MSFPNSVRSIIGEINVLMVNVAQTLVKVNLLRLPESKKTKENVFTVGKWDIKGNTATSGSLSSASKLKRDSIPKQRLQVMLLQKSGTQASKLSTTECLVTGMLFLSQAVTCQMPSPSLHHSIQTTRFNLLMGTASLLKGRTKAFSSVSSQGTS